MSRYSMTRFRRGLAALLLCVAPSAALAQQPIVQSGRVTPNHPLMVITNGVAGDAGTAAQGNLTGIGTTFSGPSICANSGPVTGPYNQLCLGVTQTGGGTIALNNIGGATGGLAFTLNGVPTGGGGGGGIPDFNAPPGQFINGFSGGVPLTGLVLAANVSGLGTMAQQNSNAVAITGGTITGLPLPASPSDAVNKQYADAIASGLNIHNSVALATSAALPTYTWSSAGGGTLTEVGNGQLTVDGVGVTNGQRILVKNELGSGTACNGNINSACDGIYTVTTAGTAGTQFVIVRSSALASNGQAENTAAGWPGGDTVLVTGGSGTVNNNTNWTNTAHIVTLNLTAFSFVQTGASGSSQWITSGVDIYFNTGGVFIGSAPAETAFDTFAVAGGAIRVWSGVTTSAWTTQGIRFRTSTATLTDTTSSGTVAAGVSNAFAADVIAASNAATFTNYYTGYFSRPAAGTNVTLTNSWGLGADNISITPPGNSLVTGLGITQTGAGGNVTTGVAQMFNYNYINIPSDVQTQDGSGGVNPITNGLLVFMQPGAGGKGQKQAFTSFIFRNGAAADLNRDTIAGSFIAGTNVPNNGTNLTTGASGSLFALAPGATASSGATNLFMVSGGEVDVGINTGASSRFRMGWSVVAQGNLAAADSIYDAAYEIGATSGAPASWKNGLLFSNLHGSAAISSTGCMICTDTVSITVATGIDFSNYNITGNFLNSIGFSVDGTGAVTSAKGLCPPGYFCVARYGSLAAAVSAANSAGGGTVWLGASVTVSAAQVIPANVNVMCANKTAVVIHNSSATADTLDVTGGHSTIAHCGFDYTGAGNKTAGYFVSLAADDLTLYDFWMNKPFIGVQIQATTASVIDGDINNATPGTGGAIDCTAAGSASVTDVVLEAVGASGSMPSFGLRVSGNGSAVGCALHVTGSAFLTAQNGVIVNPSGAAGPAFLHMNNSNIDTCTTGVEIQPGATGVVGYVELNNVEIGSSGVGTSGDGVDIDTRSGGGIFQVIISGSTIYSYRDTVGSGISLFGALTTVLVGTTAVGKAGSRFANAFNLNTGASCHCQIIGNSLFGSSNSLAVTPITTTSQIMFNNLNGGGQSIGGNSATNVANNL